MQIARDLLGRLEKRCAHTIVLMSMSLFEFLEVVSGHGEKEDRKIRKGLKRNNQWYREAELSMAKTYGQQI